VLLLIAVLHNCAVAETWVTATLASWHTDRTVKHNERNFGLGVEHDVWKDTRVVGGFYKNSYYRQSQYVGALWLPLQANGFKLGVLLGAVTGYDRLVGPFQPTVLPTIMYERKQWGANIGVMPSPQSGVTALGLQVKWKWR
jgi:hypothetical protein